MVVHALWKESYMKQRQEITTHNQRIIDQEEIGKKFENPMGKLFDHPLMKHQVTGNQFVQNVQGEIRLTGDFVGEQHYISLQDVRAEAQTSKKKIVLNIGDSSTSGWDSDVVARNQRMEKELGSDFDKNQALFPLFNYKTYSDCLRDNIGGKFIVINAGIPTHTSLNGLRRLKELGKTFDDDGISIDYVTIYYGNNDSTCNANIEEKNRNAGFFKKSLSKIKDKNKIIPRTSLQDYIAIIESIVKYCHSKHMIPILILPVIPLYWEPARRVKREIDIAYDEIDEQIQSFHNQKVGKPVWNSYQESLQLWRRGNEEYLRGNRQSALTLYHQARELDYMTPRIKYSYKVALDNIAKKMDVPLVKVVIPQEKDDGRSGEGYFCDYCHPIEPANRLIANEITKIISAYETGERRVRDKDSAPLSLRVLEKILDFCSCFYQGRSTSQESHPPTDTYTIY
jgi:lysophospholipase L1-like esterase